MTHDVQALLEVTHFLASDESHSIRRQLLDWPYPQNPSWEIFVSARLNCDIDASFVATETEQTFQAVSSPIAVTGTNPSRISPEYYKQKHKQVVSLLADVFKATTQTLKWTSKSKNSRNALKELANNNKGELFHLFGIPQQCSSLNTAKHLIRQMSFQRRRQLVALLIEKCSKKDRIRKFPKQFLLEVRAEFLSMISKQEGNDKGDSDNETVTVNSRGVPAVGDKLENPLEDIHVDKKRKGESDVHHVFTSRESDDNAVASKNSNTGRIEKTILQILVATDNTFVRAVNVIHQRSANCSFVEALQCSSTKDYSRAATSTDHDNGDDDELSNGVAEIVCQKYTTVETIRLKGPGCEPVVFRINNFLPSEFRRDFISSLNTVHFMEGVDGRKSSFVRISSIDDPEETYFHIGSRLYPCQPASSHEKKMLDVINSLIQVQNSCLREGGTGACYDNDSTTNVTDCLLRLKVNTLQIVVEYITSKSGYGLHSDVGALLNEKGSLDYNQLVTMPNEQRLPTREEMQTFTVVLTTCSDPTAYTHNLMFYGNTEEKMGQVRTSGNCLHAQLHGSQLFQHKVAISSKHQHEKHALRIVVSARFTKRSPPSLLKEKFGDNYQALILDDSKYRFLGVIDHLSKGCDVPAQEQDCDKLNTTKTRICPPNNLQVTGCAPGDNKRPSLDIAIPAIPKKQIRDGWAQIEKGEFGQYHLYRADGKLKAINLPPWKFWSGAHVVRNMALSYGIVTTIAFDGKRGAGVKKQSPELLASLYSREKIASNRSVHKLLLPLDKVPLMSLVSDVFTGHTDRSHPVCPGNHEKTNLLLLTEPYKNDSISIENYVDRLLSYSCRKAAPQATGGGAAGDDTPLLLPSVTIFGSGGSPHDLDAFSFDTSTHSKYQAGAIVPSPQSTETNYQNKCLSMLKDRRACVGVFITLSTFLPFLPADTLDCLQVRDPANIALFLGYFYVENSNTTYLTPKELDAQLRNVIGSKTTLSEESTKEYISYSQFRREYHISFQLAPVFNKWSDYRRIRVRNETLGFVHYSVLQSDDSEVATTIHEDAHVDDTYPNESFINRILSNKEADFELHFATEAEREMDSSEDLCDNDVLNVSEVRRGTTISDKEDIIYHLLMVMASGSLRYLRRNVYAKYIREKLRWMIGPLSEDPCTLSTIYRGHPWPMAIRAYDVMVLLIRACAFGLGILTGDGERVAPAASLLTSEFLFMAILNRFTGRPRLFLLFRDLFPAQCPSIIPGPEHLGLFLDLVKFNKCHRMLFSHQHINSIPLDCWLHEHVFCGVMKQLAGMRGKILQAMFATQGNRRVAVAELATAIRNAVDENKTHFHERGPNVTDDKCRWLAQQIVCDLEEIFIDPFGPVTSESIVFGPGARQGWYVCFGSKFNAKIASGGTIPNHGEDKTQGKEAPTSLLLDLILEKLVVNGEPGDLFCRIMGLERAEISGGKTAVHIRLNGRPLNVADIEHFLCKVYIGVAKTISSRSRSKTPQCSRPGLHPINFDSTTGPPWDDEQVTRILEDGVNAYEEATKAGIISHTPDCFLILDEPDPLAIIL